MPHILHYHKRKKKKQVPHKDASKGLIDRLIYPIAVLGPLMTVPQLLKIWFGQNAAGVSALSWTAYILTSTIWLWYGLAHKEKPIIAVNGCYFFLCIAIVIGTLMYG